MPRHEALEEVAGVFVIHAAVVVVDVVAEERVVDLKQRIDDGDVFGRGDLFDQALVDLADVPVGGDGIAAGGDVVKGPGGDAGLFDEVVTDAVEVVAVVDVGQVVDPGDALLAQGVDHVSPGVFGLAGNVVDEGAGEEQIVVFLGFHNDYLHSISHLFVSIKIIQGGEFYVNYADCNVAAGSGPRGPLRGQPLRPLRGQLPFQGSLFIVIRYVELCLP